MKLISYKKNNNETHDILNIFGIKIKIKKNYGTKNGQEEYHKYLEKSLNEKKDFIQNSKEQTNQNISTKLIAYYLPQYHTFEENDKWHGRGFTEWTNVTKAKPMYEGHYQPQLPIDVGFYDLSTDKIMYRQIELAKQYGIYGFCFHYYWFSGKRLMERPIFNYLNNKELNMPFCLCWANENWSKRWDGGNNEILMEQKLDENDGENFVADIIDFFKDERYIKINNNPVLIIYKLSYFEKEKITKFIQDIRIHIKKYGFDDIYIIRAKTGEENPKEYNVNATVEFPPHCMPNINPGFMNKYINKKFEGKIYNIHEYIKNKKYIYKTNEETLFKCCFPNWDNTARREYVSSILECTPNMYKAWLKDLITWTKKHNDKDKQYVFINAWNEWAEGAHLEPCNKYGYAYLKATQEALKETI